jgi:hypothetical protein
MATTFARIAELTTDRVIMTAARQCAGRTACGACVAAMPDEHVGDVAPALAREKGHETSLNLIDRDL